MLKQKCSFVIYEITNNTVFQLLNYKTDQEPFSFDLQMLNNYNSDPDSRYMVDNYDWIWFPVANPDGYEYTHEDDGVSFYSI